MDRFSRVLYNILFVGVHLFMAASPFVLWDSGVDPWLIGGYNAIAVGIIAAFAIFLDIEDITHAFVWYAGKMSDNVFTGSILTLAQVGCIVFFFVSSMTWGEAFKGTALPTAVGFILLGIVGLKFRARAIEQEERTSSEIE